MPNRCNTCNAELAVERILALLDMNVPLDEHTCVDCSK